MENYINILIVRTDRIGDVVLTTSAIRVLRKKFPRSKISVLVAKATRELLDGHPDIDEVLVDDRKGEHRGLWGFVKLIQALRGKKFDLVIVLHTKRRTNLLCFLAGVPIRVGFADNKFGFLLTKKLADQRHLGLKHESQYCLDVLSAIGVSSANLEFFLPVSKSAEEWAKGFFRSQNINPANLVAIHPGASDPTKEWPPHRFAELIDQIKEKYGSQFVLIGTEQNRSTADRIMSGVNCPVYDLTGKTTVSQLTGLLKHCRLLISNDSGPVHIADALGTPVISIFTRNQPGINPERWQPLGKHSRVIVTPFKGEKSFIRNDPASPEYLELIPTQQVFEAVDAIFKLC